MIGDGTGVHQKSVQLRGWEDRDKRLKLSLRHRMDFEETVISSEVDDGREPSATPPKVGNEPNPPIQIWDYFVQFKPSPSSDRGFFVYLAASYMVHSI